MGNFAHGASCDIGNSAHGASWAMEVVQELAERLGILDRHFGHQDPRQSAEGWITTHLVGMSSWNLNSQFLNKFTAMHFEGNSSFFRVIMDAHL